MNYQRKVKTKVIIFISLNLLILMIFLIDLLQPTDFNFNPNTYMQEKQEKKLIESIVINGIEAVYDKHTDTYLFPITSDKKNRRVPLNIKVISSSKTNFVTTDEYIKNQKLFDIVFEKPIKITAYNENNYDTVNLTFTTIPIISINTDDEIDVVDQKGTVKLIDNNTDLTFRNANIRTRGGLSLTFDKKGYRITLDDHLPLLDMPINDTWILDNLYMDTAKIRNVLAINLWNLMNSYNTYKELDIDFEAKFVEVYVNNEYMGLYTLKEPVNREKLGLNKKNIKDSGVLLKGTGIGKISIKEFESSNTNYLEYNIFELKYPNNVEKKSIYWKTILNKLKYYYSDTIFDEDTLENHFYINNIVDYKILYTITEALDNCFIRNVYMSLQNLDKSKVILTPWDFDFSMGLVRDSDSLLLSKTDYNNFDVIACDITYEEQPILTKTLINRYKELRREVITTDIINSILDKYLTLLVNSNSTIRDADKWYRYDIKEEINNIKIWFEKRLAFLDNYIEEL